MAWLGAVGGCRHELRSGCCGGWRGFKAATEMRHPAGEGWGGGVSKWHCVFKHSRFRGAVTARGADWPARVAESKPSCLRSLTWGSTKSFMACGLKQDSSGGMDLAGRVASAPVPRSSASMLTPATCTE